MIGEKLNIVASLLVAGGICIANAQTEQKDVNITGSLYDTLTQAALSGAKVSLANNPSVTTTTSADGSFKLMGTATVGLHSGIPAASEGFSISGTNMTFSVTEASAPVLVSVYTLKNELVRTVLDQRLASGNYGLDVGANLARGLYLARAQVGKRSATFKVTSLGRQAAGDLLVNAAARVALSKASAAVIDTLIITKDGYKRGAKGISTYTGNYTVLLKPRLTQISVVSARQPTVWTNCDAFVYDPQPGTQLKGNWTPAPFEGGDSWRITFSPDQSSSVWAFAPKTGTADMSDFKDGALHIAVKGSVASIGIFMASAENAFNATKVDVTKFGYKPDGAWHEMNIPVSEFKGTNLEMTSVYLGMGYPTTDTDVFDATLEYQIDDAYWKSTK